MDRKLSELDKAFNVQDGLCACGKSIDVDESALNYQRYVMQLKSPMCSRCQHKRAKQNKHVMRMAQQIKIASARRRVTRVKHNW